MVLAVGIALVCALTLFALASCSSGGSASSSKGNATSAQELPVDDTTEKQADASLAEKVGAQVGTEADAQKAADAAKTSPDKTTLEGAGVSIALQDANYANADKSAFVAYVQVTNTGDAEQSLSDLCAFTARQSFARNNPTGTYVLGPYEGSDAAGNSVPSDDIMLAPGESAPFSIGWKLAEGAFLSVELSSEDGEGSLFLTFDL